jgi:glyoxylase-like metal-dependent hydrolase (beta-lactamase superfamily II)
MVACTLVLLPARRAAGGITVSRESHAVTPPGGGKAGLKRVAPGVAYRSILGSNVFFVRSGASWVLIDTAWANSGFRIRQAAEALFGTTPPTAIVLTHAHPDHAGAAPELARLWGCPVYVHPDDLPLALPADLATIERYANPLDRWVILPVMRALPPRRVAAIMDQGSFKERVRTFDLDSSLPFLPEWKAIPTPGHSPDHSAFFRASDRVLITGDALLTVNVNSLWGWLAWGLGIKTPRLSPPPWYTNTDQGGAKRSIAVLAQLEPRVLATGHGRPMKGAAVAGQLRAFARQRAPEG